MPEKQRPLRILHVYKCADPTRGGIAKFMAELAQGMHKRSGICHPVSATTGLKQPEPHDANALKRPVHFHILSIGPRLSEEGKTLLKSLPNVTLTHCTPLVTLAGLPLSLKAFWLFRRCAQNADMIHHHFPYPFLDLLVFLLNPRLPILVTYHADITRQKILLFFFRPLKKWLLRKACAVVTTSPDYQKSSSVLKNYSQKTKTIPLGISEIPPPQDTLLNDLQEKLPKQFFLFLGAFRHYKGLDTLMAAASLTPTPLVLAGGGALFDRVQEQSAHLPHVTLLGPISESDKAALLTLCQGFVFPSDNRAEAFGLSLLEAAMFSKPLITCDIGSGTSYVNRHRKTGLVIPPKNPQALADALHFLLSHPKEAKKLGAGARKRYQDLFTTKKMAHNYHHLYADVLAEHNKAFYPGKEKKTLGRLRQII